MKTMFVKWTPTSVEKTEVEGMSNVSLRYGDLHIEIPLSQHVENLIFNTKIKVLCDDADHLPLRHPYHYMVWMDRDCSKQGEEGVSWDSQFVSVVESIVIHEDLRNPFSKEIEWKVFDFSSSEYGYDRFVVQYDCHAWMLDLRFSYDSEYGYTYPEGGIVESIPKIETHEMELILNGILYQHDQNLPVMLDY
jgi:hypothetical protein